MCLGVEVGGWIFDIECRKVWKREVILVLLKGVRLLFFLIVDMLIVLVVYVRGLCIGNIVS